MNDILYSAIKNLITTYDEGVQDYAKLDAELRDEAQHDRVTQTVANEQRQELQNVINRKLGELNNNVQGLLESYMENQEMKAREQLTTTLDANDSGELMLLGTMDNITQDDLNNYLEKYSDKPLAIRKIQQIAKNKDITLGLSEEQQRIVDPMGVVKENKRRIDYLINNNSRFNTNATTAIELTKRNAFNFSKGNIEELGRIQKNSLS